mmetsp:Transcript_38615/g.90701  ORF Transcript_38615/g.90701 Transcript_38615/m.90701 type:complete len:296 (-) Transcript_38615:369-1256(-)
MRHDLCGNAIHAQSRLRDPAEHGHNIREEEQQCEDDRHLGRADGHPSTAIGLLARLRRMEGDDTRHEHVGEIEVGVVEGGQQPHESSEADDVGKEVHPHPALCFHRVLKRASVKSEQGLELVEASAIFVCISSLRRRMSALAITHRITCARRARITNDATTPTVRAQSLRPGIGLHGWSQSAYSDTAATERTGSRTRKICRSWHTMFTFRLAGTSRPARRTERGGKLAANAASSICSARATEPTPSVSSVMTKALALSVSEVTLSVMMLFTWTPLAAFGPRLCMARCSISCTRSS